MRISKNDKINYIKENLLPLMSYIDINSPEAEKYEWIAGDLKYKIIKHTTPDPKLPFEIYISISGKKKTHGDCFVYKGDYDTGDLADEFFDFNDFKVQVIY